MLSFVHFTNCHFEWFVSNQRDILQKLSIEGFQIRWLAAWKLAHFGAVKFAKYLKMSDKPASIWMPWQQIEMLEALLTHPTDIQTFIQNGFRGNK